MGRLLLVAVLAACCCRPRGGLYLPALSRVELPCCVGCGQGGLHTLAARVVLLRHSLASHQRRQNDDSESSAVLRLRNKRDNQELLSDANSQTLANCESTIACRLPACETSVAKKTCGITVAKLLHSLHAIYQPRHLMPVPRSLKNLIPRRPALDLRVSAIPRCTLDSSRPASAPAAHEMEANSSNCAPARVIKPAIPGRNRWRYEAKLRGFAPFIRDPTIRRKIQIATAKALASRTPRGPQCKTLLGGKSTLVVFRTARSNFATQKPRPAQN